MCTGGSSLLCLEDKEKIGRCMIVISLYVSSQGWLSCLGSILGFQRFLHCEVSHIRKWPGKQANYSVRIDLRNELSVTKIFERAVTVDH